MKHYNGANVWGTLREFTRKTTQGGKHYIEVSLDCASEKYGNVRAFGRLWGEAAELFMGAYRPGAPVVMRGMLSQYKGRKEKIKTNFNFYYAEPWDPANSKHPHRRAAFIIVGEVKDVDGTGSEGRVTIEFRPEKGEAKTFKLSLHPSRILDIAPGGVYRLKGAMAQEEDEWGQVTTFARPVVVDVEKITLKEDEVSSFVSSGEEGQGEVEEKDVPF